MQSPSLHTTLPAVRYRNDDLIGSLENYYLKEAQPWVAYRSVSPIEGI